jgi:hypothetical protein
MTVPEEPRATTRVAWKTFCRTFAQTQQKYSAHALTAKRVRATRVFRNTWLTNQFLLLICSLYHQIDDNYFGRFKVSDPFDHFYSFKISDPFLKSYSASDHATRTYKGTFETQDARTTRDTNTQHATTSCFLVPLKPSDFHGIFVPAECHCPEHHCDNCMQPATLKRVALQYDKWTPSQPRRLLARAQDRLLTQIGLRESNVG